MVEPQPSKLMMGVRSSSPAPAPKIEKQSLNQKANK